jgi:hydroxymethylbilane synthase
MTINDDLGVDENTNEIIPRKRRKMADLEIPLNIETTQLTCNNSTEQLNNRCRNCPLKLGSPKIIDDTPTASGSKFNETIDIEELIKIHGDAFKKCPYAVQIEKVLPKGVAKNESKTKKEECPKNFNVVPDVMGVCPILNTEQKIQMGEEMKCPVSGKSVEQADSISKCPVTAKTTVICGTDNKDAHPIDFNAVPDVMGVCPVLNTKQKIQLGEGMICPITGQSAVQSETSKKCPVATQTSDISEPEDKPVSSNINKCPFLTSNHVKLIDYNENTNNVQPDIIDNSEILYCGMHKHNWLAKSNIFAKCEELGRNLAENLINKGALEVMQCAQREIHSSIVK